MKLLCGLFLIVLNSGFFLSDDSVRSVSVLREIPSPALQGSGQPFLQVTPDGNVLLSWIEAGQNAKHALRYSTFDKGSWSKAQTVVEGNDFFVNWADVPSVLKMSGGRVVAHWLNKSGASTYAYDVQIKTSTDGGKSWSNTITPHRDGTQTEHGFVSLFDLPGDKVGLAWLDGRAMAGEGGAGHDGQGGKGSMTLRGAVLDSENRLEQEAVLDARVCECCPTAVARTENGIVLAYRDRSEKEIRDIYVVRYEGGRWTEPYPVHEDGWQIPGCPVNGPALSARGKNVVIAWFTAANGEAKVNVAFSKNNGASFGSPTRVDGGKPLGRVDVELLSDGSGLVSWIEWRGENSELRVCRVLPNGAKGRVLKVTPISAERASGYPRMVVHRDKVFFAWTEVGSSKRVRVAETPLTDLLR